MGKLFNVACAALFATNYQSDDKRIASRPSCPACRLIPSGFRSRSHKCQWKADGPANALLRFGPSTLTTSRAW
ncbi:unnamed protein product [Heligmosomoides polygyrus]|uniref:Secreted protein n=1 Tax=Heligmosomoides polygyrus TaxID=6339 RepID=A0A183GLJ1_HELPZ|nr:unnamed protein product [Heligmosomoides polygyrus]